MIILTDGKNSLKIEMREFDGNQLRPCWEHDFFEVGALRTDENGAYCVADVIYCLQMALEWCRENENNKVWIEPY